MLLETNKFREHQSRELLIELLEKQLAERQKLLEEVEDGIKQADDLLSGGEHEEGDATMTTTIAAANTTATTSDVPVAMDES